jgi:uncharacterized OB-fold protein
MSERPADDPEATRFWEACAEGRLEVQRCRACGARFLFPRALCPECSSSELDWLVASGRGTLYSYTIVWRAGAPHLDVPYVLALVDLDEGVRLMTHIVNCPHDQLAVGMPVRVRFDPPLAGRPMPLFERYP